MIHEIGDRDRQHLVFQKAIRYLGSVFALFASMSSNRLSCSLSRSLRSRPGSDPSRPFTLIVCSGVLGLRCALCCCSCPARIPPSPPPSSSYVEGSMRTASRLLQECNSIDISGMSQTCPLSSNPDKNLETCSSSAAPQLVHKLVHQSHPKS